MLVKTESRSRVGIEWYDDEAEANVRATRLGDTSAADIGYVQCGRDKAFDTTIDGRPAYAVVTP